MIAIKKILVATDFSEPAEAALQYGMELARKFDASLHVLHVVDDLAARPNPLPGVPPDTGALQTTLEEDARINLVGLISEPDRTSLRVRLQTLTSAWPGQAIVSYARDAAIDLIVVGTHCRGGVARFFLGSVAQQVARTASCPVLTVRAHERDFIYPDALKKVEHDSIARVQ